MTEESNNQNLTKFPNAEKANQAAPAALPSAFDLFKPSIDLIKNNLMAFLILVGIPIVLMLIGEGPNLFKPATDAGMWQSSSDGVWGFIGTIGLILSILAAPGMIILQLTGARKQAPLTWSEAFRRGLQQFWRFLGLIIVMGVLLFISLLLLIVPFFIVLPRVFLAPYFLIDQKLGVGAALKASNEAYKAHKGTWGVIGVSFLLGLAAVIPIIGFLVTNILSFLYAPACAIRYEQIKLLSEGQAPRTPIETAPAPAAQS